MPENFVRWFSRLLSISVVFFKIRLRVRNWHNAEIKVRVGLIAVVSVKNLQNCGELTTLQMYGSLTATLTKRLNAAHHGWQRSILGIS